MMLQQTQIVTALPYFERWVARWPDWRSLAKAGEDEVLTAWTGLGYYQRARRLLELAKVVCQKHEGQLPDSVEELSQLPGLGPYASEAVAAIAFNKPAFPIDGNVRRVLSRYYADKQISPSKAQDAFFRDRLMPTFVRTRRRRELAQALMELGALVCKPRNPLCEGCPVKTSCACAEPNLAKDFPLKKTKAKPKKKWILFVWVVGDETLALRKRPSGGRFPSQWEPVSAEGKTREEALQQLSSFLPKETFKDIEWKTSFRRDFTTFHVHWEPGLVRVNGNACVDGYENVAISNVDNLNLVPVMGKNWAEISQGMQN